MIQHKNQPCRADNALDNVGFSVLGGLQGSRGTFPAPQADALAAFKQGSHQGMGGCRAASGWAQGQGGSGAGLDRPILPGILQLGISLCLVKSKPKRQTQSGSQKHGQVCHWDKGLDKKWFILNKS